MSEEQDCEHSIELIGGKLNMDEEFESIGLQLS